MVATTLKPHSKLFQESYHCSVAKWDQSRHMVITIFLRVKYRYLVTRDGREWQDLWILGIRSLGLAVVLFRVHHKILGKPLTFFWVDAVFIQTQMDCNGIQFQVLKWGILLILSRLIPYRYRQMSIKGEHVQESLTVIHGIISCGIVQIYKKV